MWRILLILLFLPTLVNASNAGIVRGLWYDQETFFTGDTVRMYVAIRNNTSADLSGTVEFFVNDTKIERKNIDALNGRIVESWADWKPSYGTSTITATLSRTEITSTASGSATVALTSTVAEDVIFVDYDSDDDGVGNQVDIDDDNDGISDTEEEKGGSNPLDPNDPPKSKPEVTTSEAEGSADSEADATGDESSTSVSGRSTTNSSVNRTIGSTEPAGLEQFLVASRADTILSNVTDVINTTKKKVDDYREERVLKKKIEAGEVHIPVNEDGFGEIIRISPVENDRPVAQKPDGFLGDLVTFIGNIFSAVFTGVLFIFSTALGHPILMQLLFLFLILLLIYKLASRLGRRPQK